MLNFRASHRHNLPFVIAASSSWICGRLPKGKELYSTSQKLNVERSRWSEELRREKCWFLQFSWWTAATKCYFDWWNWKKARQESHAKLRRVSINTGISVILEKAIQHYDGIFLERVKSCRILLKAVSFPRLHPYNFAAAEFDLKRHSEMPALVHVRLLCELPG